MTFSNLLTLFIVCGALSLTSANPADDFLNHAYHKSLDFLSDPPIWGIVVIIVVGLIVIAAILSLIKHCCFQRNAAAQQTRSSTEKAGDIESTGETDHDSVELTPALEDENEKYVPSSIRRSFKLDETNDGISATEIHTKHPSLASKASAGSLRSAGSMHSNQSFRSNTRPSSHISHGNQSLANNSVGNQSQRSIGTQIDFHEHKSSVRYV